MSIAPNQIGQEGCVSLMKVQEPVLSCCRPTRLIERLLLKNACKVSTLMNLFSFNRLNPGQKKNWIRICPDRIALLVFLNKYTVIKTVEHFLMI